MRSWQRYRRSLGGYSKEALERVFGEARRYCSASSNAVRPTKFEGMLMAIVAAHETRMEVIGCELEKVRLEIRVRD